MVSVFMMGYMDVYGISNFYGVDCQLNLGRPFQVGESLSPLEKKQHYIVIPIRIGSAYFDGQIMIKYKRLFGWLNPPRFLSSGFFP